MTSWFCDLLRRDLAPDYKNDFLMFSSDSFLVCIFKYLNLLYIWTLFWFKDCGMEQIVFSMASNVSLAFINPFFPPDMKLYFFW